MSIPFIKGTVIFQSNMILEEVGVLISKKMFGNLAFQGLDKRIYDEIPAIFIDNEILGLRIVLSGYSGYLENQRFVLDISPLGFSRKLGNVEAQEVEISEYLKLLMQYYFKDDTHIKLL